MKRGRNSGPGSKPGARIARAFSSMGEPGKLTIPTGRSYSPLFETYAPQSVLAATGDTALDNAYKAALVAPDIGGRILVTVYENDLTSDGHRVTNDIALVMGEGNPDASVSHPYLIQLLEEKGVVAGALSPTYVMLDFESTFLYPWLEGYDTPENEELSRSRLGAAIDAVKAHFGSGIKVSMWGMPAIPYNEIVGKSDSYQATAIDDVVDRFSPLVRKFDFIVPSTYDYWANTESMSASTREFEVVAHGTQALLLASAAEFDAKWAAAFEAREANVTCALRIAAMTTVDVLPSHWALYTPSGSLCFRANDSAPTYTGTDEGQFIPRGQYISNILAHIARLGVSGYHAWNPVDNFFNRAFRTTNPAQSYRSAIVRAFYGGVSPVVGDGGTDEYPRWDDPALRADWAVRHNDRFISKHREIALRAR